jgi:chromosome segregation protein
MLKALELFGFKSFADRTRFEFAPGVTCVVGPNGSGKSNVVDAIKWILGDQSPKSLRGKEMTDVIFNGSSNRKPAGLAEATLTFDNTKRFLGVDADEVHIGRRIYRSGEAEYLINRVPARLKDIKELFLGTGAGTAAYSIIEQGRVDQLLQATNVARRLVFEEAAGISRFKVKKSTPSGSWNGSLRTCCVSPISSRKSKVSCIPSAIRRARLPNIANFRRNSARCGSGRPRMTTVICTHVF